MTANLRLIEKIAERRKKMEGFEPPEPGAPIRYPRMLERQYDLTIRSYVRAMRKTVDDTLMDQLPSLLDQIEPKFDAKEIRTDDPFDTLISIFKTFPIVFGRIISQKKIENDVDEHGNAVDLNNSAQFSNKVRAVTGLDIFTASVQTQQLVKGWASKNVTLINKLSQDYFADIERIVTDGVSNGDSLRTISKNISAATGASRKRADLIARDQTGSLMSSLTAQRSADLGVRRFRWSTSKDDRVRASHRAVDGKVFSYEKGADLDGQSNVLPGRPINCRCSISPIISSIGETPAQTKQRVAQQSELDKSLEREKGRQKEIDRRRRETVARAKRNR